MYLCVQPSTAPAPISILTTFSHRLGTKYESQKVENFIDFIGQNEIIINNIDKEIVETIIIKYKEFHIDNNSKNSTQ